MYQPGSQYHQTQSYISTQYLERIDDPYKSNFNTRQQEGDDKTKQNATQQTR